MRLRLTIDDGDVKIRRHATTTVEPDTPLSEMAEALKASVGQPSDRPLFFGPAPLDPTADLASSELYDGAILGAGQPAPSARDSATTGTEVRVVGGPSAGMVFRIGPGRHLVGRHQGCAVSLTDEEVSREHAAIELTRSGELSVYDLGSTNGTAVEGTPLTGEPRPLRYGEFIEVGRSFLCVSLVTPPDASLAADGEGGFVFNRRYRIRQDSNPIQVAMPLRPGEPDRPGFPWLMAILPLGAAVAVALVLRRPEFLLLAVMSPVMTVGSSLNDRRSRKKRKLRDDADFERDLASVEGQVDRALAEEQDLRRRSAPDPALAVLTALGPRERLWERRAQDVDFLSIRLGLASLPSAITVTDAEGRPPPSIWGCPSSVTLPTLGVLGVSAPRPIARGIARWLVLQAAVLHSPDDLRVVVLTDEDAGPAWDWIRWLPHAQLDEARGLVGVGNSSQTLTDRVRELQRMVVERSEQTFTPRAGGPTATDFPRVMVVVDGAKRFRSLPGMLPVLQQGPGVGILSVCIDDDRSLLPEECGGAMIYDTAEGLATVEQHGVAPIAAVTPDQINSAIAEVAARALAPIHRTGGDDAASIPGSARFLDMTGLEPPSPEAIARHWDSAVETRGRATLGAVVHGALTLDLAADGPHGLVAGTTGAGKSELLQTLVAGLAVANPPEDLNFVLVDYKGGAAFRDCERLPHTVGLVTDLDAHLTERALRSLRAELKRREHVLSAANAKDISDYRSARERSGRTIPPLPRLAIVIDEFASLVEEFPDFVAGLVGIAQLGRALGVHLILATQRPSGVVSPEIRANANFAIALRVVNASESSDIIGSPSAATISPATPGRAYLRISQEQPVCFQTARVGGRRPGAELGRPPATAVSTPWETLGLPDPAPLRPRVSDEEATDLHALVEAISAASAAAGTPIQRQPWLDPLPPVLILNRIGPPAPRPDDSDIPLLPIGIEDVPDHQSQEPAVLDLAASRHLLFAGSPRSGRSSALRTVAASIARLCSPTEVHLYVIDGGNGALSSLSQLPHCGAVVPRSQTDRIERLIIRLAKEVEQRHTSLVALGLTNATEQRRLAQDPDRWPYLVLLLDSWEGFVDSFHDHKDGAVEQQLLALLRDGGAVGLTIVLSGDRTLLSTSRVASLIEEKIALRFNDRDDYTFVGLAPRRLPATVPAGRGFRANSGEELQIALLAEDPSGPAQAEALVTMASESRTRVESEAAPQRPFRVDPLPVRISLAEAVALGAPPRHALDLLVGVGGDQLIPWWTDLAEAGPGFVIAGPPESGRSTALLTMGRALAARGVVVVAISPRRSPLLELADLGGAVTIFQGAEAQSPDLGELLADEQPIVALVDDAEMVDPDNSHLLTMASGAPGHHGIVVAGGIDDLRDAFRGFMLQAKRPGSGLLLSPKGHLDATVFNGVLPRGSGFSGPPGRAHYFARGRPKALVQVPAG
jgi:S-DNA-T family DNA segregation ATPase FtsK/SpoIIIE